MLFNILQFFSILCLVILSEGGKDAGKKMVDYKFCWSMDLGFLGFRLRGGCREWDLAGGQFGCHVRGWDEGRFATGADVRAIVEK